MKKRRIQRSQRECHMIYGMPCHTQAQYPCGLCFRMCKKVFLNQFGMKVKPATTLNCNKRKASIAINQSPQNLQFDSLQPGISSESITIALNKTLTNVPPTKLSPFKLMRTASQEMLMWQVVTDAFGSWLRYAQESINIFFCPT